MPTTPEPDRHPTEVALTFPYSLWCLVLCFAHPISSPRALYRFLLARSLQVAASEVSESARRCCVEVPGTSPVSLPGPLPAAACRPLCEHPSVVGDGPPALTRSPVASFFSNSGRPSRAAATCSLHPGLGMQGCGATGRVGVGVTSPTRPTLPQGKRRPLRLWIPATTASYGTLRWPKFIQYVPLCTPLASYFVFKL